MNELRDWMQQDVATGVKRLIRDPAYSIAVVATLALGIGANASIFAVLNRVYLREPPGVARPSSLGRIYARRPDLRTGTDSKPPVIAPFDYPTYAAIRDITSRVAITAAYTIPDSSAFEFGDRSFSARMSYVSDNYFAVLGVQPALGSLLAPGESPVERDGDAVVLSYSLWLRQFGGDTGVVGKRMTAGRRSFVVKGVAAKDFSGIELDDADLFFPLGAFRGPSDAGKPWYATTLGSYLRLVARPNRDGDRGAFTAAATVAYRRTNADGGGQLAVGSRPDTTSIVILGPLVEASGPAKGIAEIGVATRVAGVTLIIFLIACANVANLMLIRGIRRRRDVAIQLAMGISRRRLAFQHFVECAMLAAMAGLSSVLLALWGGAALWTLLLPNLHWSGSRVDAHVLAVVLVLSVGAALALGLPTALQAVHTPLVGSPSFAHGSRSPRGSRVRSALMAFQCAASLILLVGASAFVLSVTRLRAIPLGYAWHELAFMSVGFSDGAAHTNDRRNLFPMAAERLAAHKDITGVALAEHAPMLGGSAAPVFLPGADTTVGALSSNSVSPNFFSVVGMPIVLGRAISVDDRWDGNGSVVVNETMAQSLWPRENPIGKCILIGSRTQPCTYVVGVVTDAHQRSVLEVARRAQYFRPLRASVDTLSKSPGALIIRSRRADWTGLGEQAQAAVRAIVPSATSVRFRPMYQYLDRELRPWRLGADLFVVFGGLALFVAAVGTYSLMSYSVSQRAFEIAVRSALGATAANNYFDVLRGGLTSVVIGLVVGVLLAIAGNRLIATFLYHTSPEEPAVLGAAMLVLLIVGAVACAIPAARATHVDPMRTLRGE